MSNDPLLTNAELCMHLRCSDTTLWRMRQIPGFPQPLRFGRRLLWSREQLDQILSSAE